VSWVDNAKKMTHFDNDGTIQRWRFDVFDDLSFEIWYDLKANEYSFEVYLDGFEDLSPSSWIPINAIPFVSDEYIRPFLAKMVTEKKTWLEHLLVSKFFNNELEPK